MKGKLFPLDKFLNWVVATLLLGLRCKWKTSWCGFYDRINCILEGRNVLLGMWRGCDQVQIVCVLYWNLNIAAEFVMSVPGVSLISASIDMFQCEKQRLLISSTEQKDIILWQFYNYNGSGLLLEWENMF